MKHHSIKAYGGSGGVAPLIITLALDGDRCSASGPGRFTSGIGLPARTEEETGELQLLAAGVAER